MTGSRSERLARNEATFRAANERAASWEERQQDDRMQKYFCECGLIECRQIVHLDHGEYEAVRSDSRHFFVVVGHADLTVERVIRFTPRYDVVQKIEDVRPLVERTDPRRQ